MGTYWESLKSIDKSQTEILISQASPLECVILSEDVLQDVRVELKDVVNYLVENISELIDLALELPPESSSSERKFRVPFIAVELLVCDCEKISHALANNLSKLIDILSCWGNYKTCVCPVLAGYFAKILTFILIKHPKLMESIFVEREEEISMSLISCLDSPSLCELFAKFLVSEDEEEVAMLRNFDVSKIIFELKDADEIKRENINRLVISIVEGVRDNHSRLKRLVCLDVVEYLSRNNGWRILHSVCAQSFGYSSTTGSPWSSPRTTRLHQLDDDHVIFETAPQLSHFADDASLRVYGDLLIKSLSIENLNNSLTNQDIFEVSDALEFTHIYTKYGNYLDDEVAEMVNRTFWRYPHSSIIHNHVLGIATNLVINKRAEYFAKIFVSQVIEYSHDTIPENLKSCAGHIGAILAILLTRYRELCESINGWAPRGSQFVSHHLRISRKLADVPTTPASSGLGRTIAIDLPVSDVNSTAWGSEFNDLKEDNWAASWDD